MKQIFDDDYFNKLDENLSFKISKDWNKIHVVGVFESRIITVMNKCKSDKPDMFNDVPIPAKTVVQLVKSREYNIKFENFGNPTIIEGLWAIKDAVGFPYVKHWTELVVYYRDKNLTTPLKYDGDGNFENDFYKEPETRDWNYKMANALLGLEEHNDILIAFFSDKKAIIRACKRYKIPVPVSVQAI